MKRHNTLLTFLFTFLGFINVEAQTFSLVFHAFDDLPSIFEIDHGDFNDDGSMDFVMSSQSNGSLLVGLGDGIEMPVFDNLEVNRGVFDLEVIDFDEDGDLDIVGSDVFADQSYAWLNDGSANFTRVELPFEDYQSILFADFNNDGRNELIVYFDDAIRLYNLNNGIVTFNAVLLDDPFAGSALAMTSLDYDQDGDLDFVVAFAFDGIVLFEQTSTLRFNLQMLNDGTFNDDDIFVADFNEDGIFDFVVQSDFERSSALLLSEGNFEYSTVQLTNQFGPNRFTTVADFDNDGTPEIIQSEGDFPSNAGLSVVKYDPVSEILNQEIIAEQFSDTYDGGVVDINNDGHLDFYFFTNDLADTGLAFYLGEDPLVDEDMDGFANDVDCDDSNPDVNPGQMEEPYNGIDDDCDAATLDDDLDQDGFDLADDCDDNNSNVNPGEMEEPYNGVDDDCNASTLDDDLDQDGFNLEFDCDDTNENINPDAIEIANNGIDEDCDGMDLVTSTYDLEKATIKIFPNPAVDDINIIVDGQLNFGAKLFSPNGMLFFKEINTNQIPVNTLTNGLYILELKDLESDGKIVHKIIVKN